METARLRRMLFPIAAFGFCAWLWWASYEQSPEDNLTCTFAMLETQTTLLMGNVRAPIERVELHGVVDDPFEGRLYDFRGKAVVKVADREFDAEASGSLTIDASDQVQGLSITLDNAAFGNGGLRLATLNENGMLDYDDARAFAYANREFKLSHPMNYACELAILPAQRVARTAQ